MASYSLSDSIFDASLRFCLEHTNVVSACRPFCFSPSLLSYACRPPDWQIGHRDPPILNGKKGPSILISSGMVTPILSGTESPISKSGSCWFLCVSSCAPSAIKRTVL